MTVPALHLRRYSVAPKISAKYDPDTQFSLISFRVTASNGEAMRNYSLEGVQYAGIWLDMNEASSFCDGSYGTGANLTNTGVSFLLPGEPGNLVLDYRGEYLDYLRFHAQVPVGNMTVNGTLTCVVTINQTLSRRGVDLNTPPYAIRNAWRKSLPGILQLQLFQIPFIGADACGFSTPHNITLLPRRLTHLIDGNTDEELCNRVAGASRTAIAARYSLLPYWYTLSAKASLYDTSPVLPPSLVFPDEE
ncbi:hypothetical protein EV421DRAFT_1735826 [Armillaria borealis]|uniref:Glycoside hydrolase family 31 TIM barrel domain-containing protein n=1 Tax=Armillaria borealis TaxID=47425 RepID=A0AA39JJ98_9AGAR|nr:hypothetical protein EV421DRAFT_1735826 [Armillaria borealis]